LFDEKLFFNLICNESLADLFYAKVGLKALVLRRQNLYLLRH